MAGDVSIWDRREVWWKCSSGHEWQNEVRDRARAKENVCPVCRSVAVVKPSLISEWNQERNNISPFYVLSRSNKNYWWICSKGHEWKAPPNRRMEGNGCPYCCGRLATDLNNLAENNKNLLLEWNQAKNGSLTPYDVTPRSNRKVWWKCKYGHEWAAKIVDRNKGEKSTGCPDCRKNTSGNELRLYSELKTVFPKIKHT